MRLVSRHLANRCFAPCTGGVGARLTYSCGLIPECRFFIPRISWVSGLLLLTTHPVKGATVASGCESQRVPWDFARQRAHIERATHSLGSNQPRKIPKQIGERLEVMHRLVES